MNKKTLTIGIILALLLFLSACAPAATPGTPAPSADKTFFEDIKDKYPTARYILLDIREDLQLNADGKTPTNPENFKKGIIAAKIILVLLFGFIIFAATEFLGLGRQEKGTKIGLILVVVGVIFIFIPGPPIANFLLNLGTLFTFLIFAAAAVGITYAILEYKVTEGKRGEHFLRGTLALIDFVVVLAFIWPNTENLGIGGWSNLLDIALFLGSVALFGLALYDFGSVIRTQISEGGKGEGLGGRVMNRWKTRALNEHVLEEGEMKILNDIESNIFQRLVDAIDVILNTGLGDPAGTLEGSMAPINALVDGPINDAIKKVREASNKYRKLNSRTYRQEKGIDAIVKRLQAVGKTSEARSLDAKAKQIIEKHREMGEKIEDVAHGLKQAADELNNIITNIRRLTPPLAARYLAAPPKNRLRHPLAAGQTIGSRLQHWRDELSHGGGGWDKLEEARKAEQQAIDDLDGIFAQVKRDLPQHVV